MSERLRGGAPAMTENEREMFLRRQALCRVATVSVEGRPHVTPLWFVWDGSSLWLNSLVASRRWADLEHDGRVSIVVDDGGEDFLSLRGVELAGRVERVGEVPRSGAPSERLRLTEQIFMDKYGRGGPFEYDGRHAWLCLTPETTASWDYSKLRPAASTLPTRYRAGS